MKKPNIWLICTDQMRGDCIGALGHPTVETPYLDTMVYNGNTFVNAYSAVPSCIAARAALMTGMSQEQHGRKEYKDNIVWDYPNTLAGGLAQAGYHTQCVGKMHVHPQRNLVGFHNVMLHDGFLHAAREMGINHSAHQSITDDYAVWFRREKGAEVDLIDNGLECNSWVARTWQHEEYLHPTNWVASESIDFLRRRDPEKPFFLMSSFVRPHSPLDPPGFYFDMYRDKEIEEPYMGDWAEECKNTDYNASTGCLEHAQYERMRRAYYGCITHIDHQIGRMYQSLLDYDLAKDTVIIFISDHGDMIGDHNCLRKALPYEGSAKIPFIIFDPGNLLELPKGTIFDDVAELRDVMPTIYDICGIPIPDTVDGKSLLKRMKGGENVREYLHGEHKYGEKSNHYIVTAKDKYILFTESGEEQYFDLQKDPHELHNAIADKQYQERIRYLKSKLELS